MRIALIVLGVIALFVVLDAFFVVGEHEQAIITQFGRPVGAPIRTPGLKVRLPIIQKTHMFEKRFLEWDGDSNQLPTRDKRFVHVDTYARWRISDPLLFFQRLRDERGAQTRLDDILDGETRNAIAKHDLVELVRTSNREPVQTEIVPEDLSRLDTIEYGRETIRAEILQNSQARTTDLGIEILDIRFKRINYVEEVRRKVYERMIAERNRIAERFRSEGEGEASRIHGDRERELMSITSEAYRTAQEIIGRADAQAANIYASAFNRSDETRELYDFIRTMEAYQVTFDKESWLVLSTEGDFYKMLENSAPRRRR